MVDCKNFTPVGQDAIQEPELAHIVLPNLLWLRIAPHTIESPSPLRITVCKNNMKAKSHFDAWLALVLGAVLSLGLSTTAEAQNLPDTIEKIKPAIVAIGTFQRTRFRSC